MFHDESPAPCAVLLRMRDGALYETDEINRAYDPRHLPTRQAMLRRVLSSWGIRLPANVPPQLPTPNRSRRVGMLMHEARTQPARREGAGRVRRARG